MKITIDLSGVPQVEGTESPQRAVHSVNSAEAEASEKEVPSEPLLPGYDSVLEYNARVLDEVMREWSQFLDSVQSPELK